MKRVYKFGLQKVHAASQGLDLAQGWIAQVKRDPDCDKYESAGGLDSLNIKLAAAVQGVPNTKLNILITQRKQTLE